ncbi:MAG TPA: phospho-N-acetylmuramoyl-pentapeptide-transferase [Dehalococcoidia bacterium]|nr:phospho-N-acetylmuramoyl-pentapeptide-transferase [Dehalococcoidia bacterium]
MTYSLLVSGAAFVLALLIGGPIVAALRRLKFGKAISEDGPSTHATKAGTPTMGGLLIWGTVAIVTVPTNLAGRLSILLPFTVLLITMALGVIDDLGTLTSREKLSGLTWRLKFAVISALSVGVSAILFFSLDVHSVHIPRAGQYDLSYAYIPIAIITIFATTSAVSITDGLDGLLGGTAAVAFGAYAVIASLQGQEFLATFSFTVVGALLGFLWYNSHPAKLFMGDTGALPLGALLATVALMTGHWLLLPVIGIVFVAEATSTVLQIAYFKLTGGRRLFRMTPLHHHFELMGWSEPQVVMRFWLFGISGAMTGIALALAV